MEDRGDTRGSEGIGGCKTGGREQPDGAEGMEGRGAAGGLICPVEVKG